MINPRLAVVILAVGVSTCVAGCKARLGPANERDDVREENLELRNRVAELEKKLELRTDQIAVMRRAEANRANATASMPDAEPIVLTRIELGEYSGLIDTNGDGTPDLARVYVKPQNQRGRFMPVAGRAMLQAIGLPDAGEPRMLAERTYEPAEWDDAYRTGFTGTHYTLETEVPRDRLGGVTGVVLRVVLIEAVIGARVDAQAARSIAR